MGGVESLFRNLCEGLVKNGHNVIVLTQKLKGTKGFETIKGVNIHRINTFRNRYLFSFFAIPKAIQLSGKVDIIQTTTFNGAPPAWVASKISGKKIVITVHEVWIKLWSKLGDMGFFGKHFHNVLERMLYLLPYDEYIAVSKSTQSELIDIGIKKEKTTHIYNGIDYDHFNPDRYSRNEIRKKLGLEKNFICFTSGRPGVSKGIEYAIEAAKFINIKNFKYVLVLTYQSIKRYDKTVQLIDKHKLRDKIIILKPLHWNELPKYYKTADCVVVPSLSEGFGYHAAEACAMKIPVVASNTTSLPEVVSGKYLLVEPKNPRAIAEGIKKIHNGKYNKSKIKKFTVEKNVKGYESIYKKLLNVK